MTTFLAFVACGYLAALAMLLALQRQLLYVPSREPPDLTMAGLADVMTPVRLDTADGLALTAWYRPPPEAAALLLVYLHGNGGHIGHRGHKVRPYIDAGFGLLLVGYRGYGGNPGRPDEAGLYADGRAALDFLDRAGIPATRRVLYGESLGSAVAVQLALERSVAAMVLESPLTSTGEVAQARYPIFPVRWLVRDRFDSLAKIGDVATPLLIVHGERDRIVPARFARALLAAAPEPKEGVFLPQAGHNDLYDHGAAAAVLEFLRRLPAGAE